VENETAVFVDGGSTDVGKVGERRILPCIKALGLRKIDCWIITHLDEDHYNGFIEIVSSGYPINLVVISEVSAREKEGVQLMEWLKDYNIPVKVIQQNCNMRVGNLEFQCLWPDKNLIYDDHNDGSLSLLLRYKEFRGVICGDLSSDYEKKLKGLEPVNFYKANHHGSSYSSCEEFLEKTKPKITTISCGKNNHYGHPGKDTLERLTKYGSKIYDTKNIGQIIIFEKM